jgi:hypothetical protein
MNCRCTDTIGRSITIMENSNRNTVRLRWLGAKIKARRYENTTEFTVTGNNEFVVDQTAAIIVREFAGHDNAPVVALEGRVAIIEVEDRP